VVDHGAYLPLALKLAKSYKRVLYHTPWEEAYPTVNKCCIGDGFEEIERCDDIWKHKKEVDLFVFPDILHGGLQEELRSQGFPVWGSGNGDSIEINRLKFLKVLQDCGLSMPKMVEVRGITELRAHLLDLEDKYIKISRFRGTMETHHWRDYALDHIWLDMLAVKLGPLSDLIRFLVFDAIDTDIEIGGDTYCVDGQFPSHMMEAYEWKDKSAFGAFKPVGEVADCIQETMQAIGPVLGSYSYRNSFSMEIRVKDDGQFFFLDPCCRGPLPMSWGQMEIYGNLPKIIWCGANGDLVNPEPTAQFCCECILTHCGSADHWAVAEVPGDLKDAIKISNCCLAEGVHGIPPDEHGGKDIGWLVATGDTPRATLEKQLEQAKKLPDGISAATESLADLLREIAKSEEMGMEFSPMPTPDPQETVEPA
jgi:hypothetical protein